jgi:branched-chain amino acid aminotransferase
VKYNDGAVGAVSQEVYTALTSLQMGESEDTLKWVSELK